MTMVTVLQIIVVAVFLKQGVGQGHHGQHHGWPGTGGHPTTAAPRDRVYCPACTDPHDVSTCHGSLYHCTHDNSVCELQVHTDDKNRVDYRCRNSHSCESHEHHCTDDVCYHCCVGISSCMQQLHHLFSTKYATVRPQVVASTVNSAPGTTTPYWLFTASPTARPTTLSAAATTATPATTTPPTTTAPTTITTPPPTTTPAPPQTTTKPTTTTTTATTTTTTTASTAAPNSPAVTCALCGDLGSMRGCSALELLAPPTVSCPGHAPFCSTTLVQVGTDVTIVKGCADRPFCESWLSTTAVDPACVAPDLRSPGHVDCTFCCVDDLCNVKARPDDDTLMTTH